MTDTPTCSLPKLSKQHALGLKVILVGVLTILSIIPLEILDSLVYERSSRRMEVEAELAKSWGREQTISGPFLVIPYTMPMHMQGRYEDDGTTRHQLRETTRMLVVAPDTLSLDGSLDVETRKRGIYEARLYRSDIALDATFTLPTASAFAPNTISIHWEKAHLALGITDLRGIRAINLSAGEKTLEMEPGLGTPNQRLTGLHAALPVTGEGGTIAISGVLGLNGSQSLSFLPVANDTQAKIRAK
ncbi:MAG: inner membrane CreD family protein [Proteobacteria bacterium]|nr:inner membrane CreD family protein [Pseudomonadota bacterium]